MNASPALRTSLVALACLGLVCAGRPSPAGSARTLAGLASGHALTSDRTVALDPRGASVSLPAGRTSVTLTYGRNDAPAGARLSLTLAIREAAPGSGRAAFAIEARLLASRPVRFAGGALAAVQSPLLANGASYKVYRASRANARPRAYGAGTARTGGLSFRSPLTLLTLDPAAPLFIEVVPRHPASAPAGPGASRGSGRLVVGRVPEPPPTPTIPPTATPSPPPTATPSPPPTATPSPTSSPTATPSPSPSPHAISHVIVIVQENRSVDNLFHFLTGADTVSYGLDHNGNQVPLIAQSLSAHCQPPHGHSAFVTSYNNGAMNGFDLANCKSDGTSYSYAPQKEVALYLTLAASYGFANHVLQANNGPSFPAHQFLIAGQSGGIGPDGQFLPQPYGFAENGGTRDKGVTDKGNGDSCGAAPNNATTRIDLTSPYPGVEGFLAYPCYEATTIFDLLASAGYSWHYYSNKPGGLWSGPQAIQHLYNSPNFSVGGAAVFGDIAAGRLANVSYVIPNQGWSDHPQKGHYKATNGPNWVGDIVNAVGGSPYWNSTEIIVTWDDWGGWYDHYQPLGGLLSGITPYSYGFRTPVVIASAYTPPGCIDAADTSQAAILRNIETVFKLPSLNTADSWTSDDFGKCLNLSMQPRTFVPLPTTEPPSYFGGADLDTLDE